ncbi:MAG: chaperone NapD [Campylobacterales bacterium]|nr:chaperone NapD [Campylobacterales bacterium]
MNISSIVVQTTPTYLDEVVAALQKSELCDYHFHDDKGRIIVTIEGEGVEEEIKKLTAIQVIPHVVAADMHFAYTEEELNAQRDKLEIQGTEIPQWLNAEGVNVKDITYHGDLKKKF